MPGMRKCEYCKGLDKEEDLIQLDDKWIHQECKVKYQIQLAKEVIGDLESQYKSHILSKAKGELSVWVNNGTREEGPNEWELKKQWIRESRDEQKKIMQQLEFEVREFDGPPVYIDNSWTHCKKCGARITDDGRIPDTNIKHICGALESLKRDGFTHMDMIVKAILELQQIQEGTNERRKGNLKGIDTNQVLT